MTEPEKKPRKPRVVKTFQQTMEDALDREEERLAALVPKLDAAEAHVRSLRAQHTALANDINRACKLVGRKDLSQRDQEMAVRCDG